MARYDSYVEDLYKTYATGMLWRVRGFFVIDFHARSARGLLGPQTDRMAA